MSLDELIIKLAEIRAKHGNIEVCIFCNALEPIDWAKITNVEVCEGNEEEMTSDFVIINIDGE